MSSPVLTNTASPPELRNPAVHQSSPKFSRGKRVIIILAAVAICVATGLAILWSRVWPFTEKAVVEDLAEASDSTVTIRGSHLTYFPSPGCILEDVEFHHGPDKWTLITIDKLTIEGSYSGILTKQVPRIRAEGGHVFIPPFGSNVTFQTQHSSIVVGEIVANGTTV